MRLCAALLVAAFCCFSFTFAQDDAPVSGETEAIDESLEIIAVEATTFHPCAIKLPDNFDPEQQYPLVIGLHGFGSSAERFLTSHNAFADPQFVFVVPQAPYFAPQPMWIGYSWVLFETGDDELDYQTQQNSLDYLLQVEDLMRQRFNITDTYLLGFSQGGTLAYQLGLSAPERYSGIAAIAAPIDVLTVTPDLLAGCRDIRYFIAHGLQDAAVDPEKSVASRELFSANGNDVTYREFDAGHTFDADTLRAIEAWILDPEE